MSEFVCAKAWPLAVGLVPRQSAKSQKFIFDTIQRSGPCIVHPLETPPPPSLC